MSHIETAVLASKKIEAILRDGFGAEGRGLHEYLANVEHRIPPAIVKKARYIASVRNQVVHKDGVIFDIAEFSQVVDEVALALNQQLLQEQIARASAKSAETDDYAGSHDRSAALSAAKPQRLQGYLGFFCFVLVIAVGYLWIELDKERALRKSQQFAKHVEIQKVKTALEREKNKVAALQQQVEATAANAQQAGKKPATKDTGALDKSVTVKSNKATSLNDAAARLNQQRAAAAAPAVSKVQPSSEENSLLAKARAATDEYDKAYQDIHVNFVNFVQEQTKVTLGQPDVSQNANGTYNVRVPVFWTIPERELLSRLNRYFNSYDSKPLKMTLDRGISDANRLVINKRNVESTTAIKPYSGRLFSELQKIEMMIEVSLGNKKAHITIAANARCFVSCRYSNQPSDAWIIQASGKPGVSNLQYQQESPVVLEGLTEQDLNAATKPTAIVKRGRS